VIRHIVLFKLYEGVPSSDPRVKAAFDGLAGLDRKVPEIRAWLVGPNVKPRPAAYDFALISDFDDLDTLQRYVDHPEHRALVGRLDEVCTRVSTDVEV
jgi:hypothetical protein